MKSLANHLLDIVYLLGGMARRPCAIQYVLGGEPILIPPLQQPRSARAEADAGHSRECRSASRLQVTDGSVREILGKSLSVNCISAWRDGSQALCHPVCPWGRGTLSLLGAGYVGAPMLRVWVSVDLSDDSL